MSSTRAKLITGSAILAVISEAVLWTTNASYGRLIDNTNLLGIAAFLFHAPGMWIAGLFGLNAPDLDGMAPVLVTSGGIQFFLMYWGTITALLHFAPKR